MHEAILHYQRTMAGRLQQELQKRNIKSMICKPEEAKEKILALIPEGSTVMHGGSLTLKQLGISEALYQGNYDFFRKRIDAASDTKEKKRLQRLATTSDYFLGGVNAVSVTGEIINIDGGGSRIGGYVFGGGKVILVAGLNKIAPSFPEAMQRARHVAAVTDTLENGRQTPCTVDGVCRSENCYPPERQCGKILIIEKESNPERTTLVLVEGEYGF